MKVMFDTNILLDVFQNRPPHYALSVGCINRVLHGDIEGYIPAYVLTTFYDVLKKYRDPHMARDAAAWLSGRFMVALCDHDVLEQAYRCDIPDCEDAVVAMSAKHAGRTHILTRNTDDFVNSSLPILSAPELPENIRHS